MTVQLETIAIDRLIPYARNSRTHSDEQVAQVAASIREFGFTNPVLIDGEGGIIAGHGRVMAARKLGMADVPCIRLAHLSDAQKRAYIIADNKLALNAGWDDKMLALEFQDLQGMGFDLELTGFGMDDIDELLAELDATPEGNTDADETPAVQAEVVSQPGDVWLLGKHRIMCGDSTSSVTVNALFDGKKADVCFTSPPYNLGKSVSLRNGARKGAKSAYNEFEDSTGWIDLMRGFLNVALCNANICVVNLQMLSGNKFDFLKLLEKHQKTQLNSLNLKLKQKDCRRLHYYLGMLKSRHLIL